MECRRRGGGVLRQLSAMECFEACPVSNSCGCCVVCRFAFMWMVGIGRAWGQSETAERSGSRWCPEASACAAGLRGESGVR